MSFYTATRTDQESWYRETAMIQVDTTCVRFTSPVKIDKVVAQQLASRAKVLRRTEVGISVGAPWYVTVCFSSPEADEANRRRMIRDIAEGETRFAWTFDQLRKL